MRACSIARTTVAAGAAFAARAAATDRKAAIREPYRSVASAGNVSSSGRGFVQIGVAIVPGSTIATWMPSGASSMRRASVIASSACFDIA